MHLLNRILRDCWESISHKYITLADVDRVLAECHQTGHGFSRVSSCDFAYIS